jgi:hypothetical protein
LPADNHDERFAFRQIYLVAQREKKLRRRDSEVIMLDETIFIAIDMAFC